MTGGGRRRLRIALGGLLLAAALAAAAVARQRRVLVERALVQWLDGRGIPSSSRVSGFGLAGLELRGLTFGPADAPDLTIERIAVRWSVMSAIGRRATRVDVLGARLRVRWEEGRPSAGVLDVLARSTGDSTDQAQRLPVDAVAFRDVRIDIEAPTGVVTVHGDVDVTDDPRGMRARGDLHADTPWGPVQLVGAADRTGPEGPRRWRVDLSAPDIEVPGVAHLMHVAARARGVGDAIRARFAVARAAPAAATAPIEPVRLRGTLGGAVERLTVDATAATVQDGLVLQASGEIAPLAGRVELALHLPETPLDHVQPGRLFPALDGVVTAARGTVAGRGHARLRDGKPAAELALALRNVDVATEGATVRQVNGVVTVVGPPLSTPPGQMIAMAGIDAALPLEDGMVVFALEPDATLRLERAEWRLAGGTLRASGRIPLGADTRTVALVADALDLKAMLASLAFEGLSGTGTVSGTLPLRQRGKVLAVEEGHLEATGSGTLRYVRPPEAAASGTGHAQLDVLLAVLTDFHYDELALTLSGDTAKPMDMALHIRGRNPGYQDGRTIVFNVKIEAPLAGLVRSGISTYRVPTAIEKKLEAMGIGGTR